MRLFPTCSLTEHGPVELLLLEYMIYYVPWMVHSRYRTQRLPIAGVDVVDTAIGHPT